MRHAAIFSIVLLSFVGPAQAKGEWRKVCPSYYDAGFGRCILKFSGAEDTARIQASGGELIRAFIKNGVRVTSPILIVEVLADRSGEPRLVLRDPLERNVSRSFALQRARFEKLRDGVLALRFSGTKQHRGSPASVSAKDNQVCLDAASAQVDTVLSRKVATAEVDYCSDEDAAFLDHLLALAVEAESQCVGSIKTWPADELRVCLEKQIGSSRSRQATP